ncbi:MAG: transcriptional regulator [Rhizobiaceae bacterium]
MRRGPAPGVKSAADSVAMLKQSWGDQVADWMLWLAEECDASSQAAAARKLGYSPAYVSTLLHNKFKGDLNAIEKAVRGALRAETVECPGLGQSIAGNTCLEWQKKAKVLRPTNPLRVKMFRACRGDCPNSRFNQKGKDQ